MTRDSGGRAGSRRTVPAQKIRYAVMGLGWFAQAAVLPAFSHAGRNSTLSALISGDADKRERLGRRYRVKRLHGYDDFEQSLRDVDAVYIALPNHLHCEFTVRAARAGKHVLCEKPMAVTEEDCRRMIDAAAENGVKLMVGYRLHFEPANLDAVEAVRSGRIGEPRFVHGILSMQVKDGDVRLRNDLGGGTLYDLGVYPVNAARSLFRDEPTEVSAMSANNGEARFRQVDEMTVGTLRFPRERLAAFTTSFGAAAESSLEVVGTEGHLRIENAFRFEGPKRRVLTARKRTLRRIFPARDHVAAELLYFSRCILGDEEPEPSGWEGLADVRVVQALYRSAMGREPVRLEPFAAPRHPDPAQKIEAPAVDAPGLVHARPPDEGM